MAVTGKVAALPGPGKPLVLREYPLPDVGPDDILVRLTLSTICGSDVHFWTGGGPGVSAREPIGLGHEMTGRIYALGKNVATDSMGRPLKEGDRICYSYFSNCGTCWACLSGTAACLNRYRSWLGVPSDQPPHFHAAFGEYYYLRHGHWVFKVPDELLDEMVSPVNCAFSEVFYGLHKIGITLGDTVVIQGAGGLGLYATAVAREMGAGQVVVVDRVPERLALAREMGADHLLNVDDTSAEGRIAQVRDWNGGEGADVVAELTGSPVVLQEGIDMLRPGGRYLWIGNINLGVEATIQPGSLVRYSRTITGVIVYEAWVIPRVLEFIVRTRDKYPYEKVVSHKFPLEELNRALQVSEQKQVIRAEVVP